MGLVIKLFFSGSAGPEIRLFEIDRNTHFDELLCRIATRLQMLPSSSSSSFSSGELGQQQQHVAAESDVSILPWSLVRDGVRVCDIMGDWITVSSEEEWALFVRSLLPCAFDEVQDNTILEVQVVVHSSPSPSPVCPQSSVSQSANTIRKIGSALKNLFTPSSVSTRRIVNKPIESSAESTSIVQKEQQQQEQQQDQQPVNNEEEQEHTEELIDDDDDDLESSVVTSNDIVDPEENLLLMPNASQQSLGEDSSPENSDDEEEEHPDQPDSPITELQEEVEGSFEIIDDETTEQQQQQQQPPQEPAAVEIAIELPDVPPELQGGWDTLVEMGFSDHTKMLALLKKHRSKNLPRIVDLLLQEE